MSVLAARCTTFLPVFVEPVNMTKSTSSISAAPVSPAAGRDLEDVLGQAALAQPSAISSEVSGVTSEGLRIAALPAASAGMQSPKEFVSG